MSRSFPLRGSVTSKPHRCCGPPCGPIRSSAMVCMRCSRMDTCSFQSASSSTRPCCISTRRYCSVGSKLSLEKSAFMVCLLGCEEDRCLHARRGVLVEPCTQGRLTLRPEQVVEHPHLRLVVCPPRYLTGG